MNNPNIDELKREVSLRKPSIGQAEFQVSYGLAIRAAQHSKTASLNVNADKAMALL
jgi:hypothetical protein